MTDMLSESLKFVGVSAAKPGSNSKMRAWHYLTLGALLLLSIFLHFYRLDQEGYANTYYAAAVKSMLTSWQNFFFVSFDPAGFVSVDKPPLGLWVQAFSAWVFGFNGWSLLLPQALAGVLSTLVLFQLVRRIFGSTAGVLSAITLNLTPVFIAANRNNTMDSQLVLVCLLAAWAFSLSAERGRLRWLLLGTALVGIGFNIKMLQAYLVLPAFYLLYLLAAPLPMRKRFWHLGLATVVLITISLSWAVAVDLTPVAVRPYVGSSQDNSVLELIIGHNGMTRLLPGGLRALLGTQANASPGRPSGVFPPPGAQPGTTRPLPPQPNLPPGVNPPTGFAPPGGTPGAQPSNPMSFETGTPGVLRLFNQQLAGQTSWLFPLVALGALAIALQTRLNRPLHTRHQALLLWALWLLPQVIFFSMANLFHRYYLEMLAPAIAALVGAGLVAMWQDYRSSGWHGWLLPSSILFTGLLQLYFLLRYSSWNVWLSPLVLVLSLLSGAGLGLLRFFRLRSPSETRSSDTPELQAITEVLPISLSILGVLALLLAPGLWSLTPLMYGGHAGLPYAGPELQDEPGRSMPNLQSNANQGLIKFLLNHHDGEHFLVATQRANDAAPIILSTGEPVMAMGGFTGSDRILSTADLAAMIADGEVRFFYLQGNSGQGSKLMRWVESSCTPLPNRAWAGRSIPQTPQSFSPGGRSVLYDCAASTP